MLPRRAHRAAPAPEGTWARCGETVFCHEGDRLPRVMLLLPAAIGLIMGFSFALSRTLSAAPGVIPAFSAAGFTVALLCAGCILAGLPVFRRDGLVRGCATLAAPLFAPRRRPPRESAPEAEFLPHDAVAAAAAAAAEVAAKP